MPAVNLVREVMPPPMRRVMTYSPLYTNAKKDTAHGTGILCWNATEQRWCDDNGETALFTPTHWWEIERVNLPSS